MNDEIKQIDSEEVDPVRGIWRWVGCANHLLNDSSKSKDGSEVDDNSIVMLLSRGARANLGDENAYLIAAAPELLYAVEKLFEFIEAGNDVKTFSMSDARQIAVNALNNADGLYVDEEA